MKKNNWYRKPKPIRNKIISLDLDVPINAGSYTEWKFYFPDEDFNILSPLGQKINAIEEFFRKNEFQDDFIQIQLLQSNEDLMKKWPGFYNDLVYLPEETLNIINVALRNILKSPGEKLKQFQYNSLQINGFKPVQNIRDVLQDQSGNFVSVRGIIVRVDEVDIQVNWITFECDSCKSQQTVWQANGLHRKPDKCTKSKNRSCNNRSNFIPLRKSPYTRLIETQKICIQELPGDLFEASSNIPKSLEVLLIGNLTDVFGPGDDVNISGILKICPPDDNAAKQFDLEIYLEANSVTENKKNNDFLPNDTITSTDVINEIRNNTNPLRLLVHSLCPQIYGQEMVKAGLILALLGGVCTGSVKRSDIHVLLVGEPGLGKSELLQACRGVAPKGVYVSGQNCSKVGLTVKIRRDTVDKGSMEAGALVTAHGGTCFIDELDKMTGQHNALLEVMEQQKVSIAKAGVLCNIPTKTSIIAAANPIGGSFNKNKTVSENIKINAALLSRFDLVFILLDSVSRDVDVSKHLQNLHNQAAKSGTIKDYFRSTEVERQPTNININNDLETLLRLQPDRNINLISRENLKKFIAFAKKSCQPILSEEAKRAILDFYLQLREMRTDLEHIPVTPRTLEALIRLSQARARVSLSSEATLEHAQDIISIMKFSMLDSFGSESDQNNFLKNKNGKSMSSGKQNGIFCKKLLEKVQTTGNKIYNEKELISFGKSILGNEANIKNIIDSLNIKGQLLNKGNGTWSVEF